MSPSAAFVPLGASSFVGARPAAPAVCCPPRAPAAAPTAMADKKPGFSLPNPFAKKPSTGVAASNFAGLQPGDPGYVAPKDEKFEFEEGIPAGPPSKLKAKAEAEEEAEKEAAEKKDPKKKKAAASSLSKAKKTKLPVAKGTEEAEGKARGLDLLREDFLKSVPERVGVGRQDVSAIIAPSFGEPGYKPKAIETVNVSELGISPFPDDANAIGKVGGIAAVEKAALRVKKGETASAIKAKVMKKPTVVPESEIVYDIPSYLKPIPEDTPRKGLSWKNYDGR